MCGPAPQHLEDALEREREARSVAYHNRVRDEELRDRAFEEGREFERSRTRRG